MNHDQAADLRESLNALRFVEGPDDDHDGQPFRLVRVRQPGYLNGAPMYEVLVDVRVGGRDSIHLPSDLLKLVTDNDAYIRIENRTVHIRDWRAEDGGPA